MGRFLASSLGLSAASLLFAIAPATADDLVLSPTSEWSLRAYDDKCRASRTFGEGEDTVTLWLDQGGAQQNFNLTLLGQPLANPYGAGIRLKPGVEDEMIRSYITVTSTKGRPVLRMYGLTLIQPQVERDDDAERPETRITPERLAAIETLGVSGAGLKPFTLELGAMGAQFDFLQDCGARLERTLGAASRLLSGEAKPPAPIDTGEEWVQVTDWPVYLRRAQMEGQIAVRLTVNKQGNATGCNVLGSNKPQLFDDAVCLGLIKRAKFEPAIDADGEPVASYYATSITFRFN